LDFSGFFVADARVAESLLKFWRVLFTVFCGLFLIYFTVLEILRRFSFQVAVSEVE
jgi:Na+/H+-dicarboxylate symporter